MNRRRYNVDQPGLKEGLEYARRTWRDGTYEVPGLGYVVEAKEESPGWLTTFQVDGIGNKARVYKPRLQVAAGEYRSAALDALAMNLNDALLVKSEVRDVLDYVDVPDDARHHKEEFLKALGMECEHQRIQLTTGETSVMHDQFKPIVATYGRIKVPDGSESGEPLLSFVESLNRIREGDVVIGLRSDGVHANGYEFILDTFSKEKLHEWMPELLQPTAIYYQPVRRMYERINGLMHITGGGFGKLKHILPANLRVDLDRAHEVLPPQKIFRAIHQYGNFEKSADYEMYQRFNNGIGFMLTVSPENEEYVLGCLGEGAARIGSVRRGKGEIRFTSAYSGSPVVM